MSAATSTATNGDAHKGFAGMYEQDANGVPYYKFPPFPQVPVGVNIVAFRAFQPAGILQNDDIDEEVDGLGVRTVALPVQHGDVNGTGTKNAKKRRRAQAEKNAREGIKLRWDEQWEEADRSAPRRAYNPHETPEDRLHQAILEFQSSRQWTPPLQSCFDFFRQFLGIVTNPNQQQKADKKQNTDDAVISDDDDDDDAVPAAADVDPPAPFEANVVEVDDEWTAVQRLREAMLNRFLDKPDHAMKVFLSSFFSAKGLLWMPEKLRDAPTLMRFFVDYLLAHNVLPGSKRALERARVVAEVACKELPATRDISRALSPERFGESCKSAWGYTDKEDLGNVPFTFTSEEKQFKTDMAAAGVAPIDPDTAPEEPMQVDINGHTVNVPAAVAAAALQHVEPVGAGWGGGSGWDDADTGAVGWGDAHPSAWAFGPGPEGGSTDLAQAPEDWTKTLGSGKTLDDWLGPGAAERYVQQRAELSTRRVLRVLPPNPGTTGPAAQLGTLVLGAWAGPNSSDIEPPRVLLGDGPTEGEISVHVHPDVVDQVLPGFGLLCLWVQVGEKPQAGKKKKKGSSWWYIESHRGAFVSYWTVDELEEASHSAA